MAEGSWCFGLASMSAIAMTMRAPVSSLACSAPDRPPALATPEVPACARLHILSLCERRSGISSQPHQGRAQRSHARSVRSGA